MNIFLWIAQVIVAVLFIWSGSVKLFHPEQLPWPWIKQNPGLVKFTGVLDVLAGIGLILPALLRIQPKLTVYAAYGTIGLMIAAGIFHVARGEAAQIGFNIFIAVMAAFIAWGRQTKAPVASKTSANKSRVL